MASQVSQITHHIKEESFWISDAEHTDGTNTYTFTYPEQWRTVYNRNHVIGIRTINLTPAPRLLSMSGVSFSDSTDTTNINWSGMVYSDEALSTINERVTTNSNYEGLYSIQYDPKAGILGMYITNTDPKYHFVFDSTCTASDDLRTITNSTAELFTELTSNYDAFNEKYNGDDGVYAHVTYNDNGIRSLEFGNVWSREKVKVNASFVDLSRNQFLGYTNSVFNPPKSYSITCGDIKFSISLLNVMNDEEVILPSDKADTLVIEAMLMLD